MLKKSFILTWMKSQTVKDAAGESGIKKDLRTERKITTGFLTQDRIHLRKKGIYLVTCDDEEYPVKRMRFKKEDEYGLWYDDYGIYDGVILAWQPLPEPYIKNPK